MLLLQDELKKILIEKDGRQAPESFKWANVFDVNAVDNAKKFAIEIIPESKLHRLQG